MSLVDQFLTPHRDLLHEVWEPLAAVCRFLEEHGQGPSVVVVGAERDEESTDLFTIRDTLAKISLRDHTARVTRHALALLAQQYRNPEPLLPKVLTVTLGHDLGKAPLLRQSGVYTMHDHPSISATKLRAIFERHPVHWLEDALAIVAEHHRSSRNPITNLLQLADRKAREEEVSLTSKDVTIQPWETWCKADDLLPIVAEQVNVLQRGNKWTGLSLEGIVYCRPELLYEAARKLARERCVLDLTLVATSERETAYRRLVRTLKEADVLATDIGEGYYGLPYDVRSPHMKKTVTAYLVPLKLEAFGRKASEFERLKEGYLKTIVSIQRPRGRPTLFS